MELQKTKHAIKLAQWREAVQECRGSGERVKDWCNARGICEQTYYRWQRQVWEAGMEKVGLESRSSDAAVFAEYVPPSPLPRTDVAIVVQMSCGRVEIHNGADRNTVEHTLRTLQTLC